MIWLEVKERKQLRVLILWSKIALNLIVPIPFLNQLKWTVISFKSLQRMKYQRMTQLCFKDQKKYWTHFWHNCRVQNLSLRHRRLVLKNSPPTSIHHLTLALAPAQMWLKDQELKSHLFKGLQSTQIIKLWEALSSLAHLTYTGTKMQLRNSDLHK